MTSRRLSRGLRMLCVLVALGGAWSGCKKKPAPIAELLQAEGPVERQHGEGTWGGAAIGTKYYLGDAARTAEGGAALSLLNSARITMQPYTVLRFGGRGANAQISVELGAIDLQGAGSFGLDVGDVKLSGNGAVRITAKGQGKSSIELLVGTAQLASLDGQVLELEIGQMLDLGIGSIQVVAAVDAGVEPDAGVETPVAVTGDGMFEIVGKKAEVLAKGETKWAALPAGTGPIPPGAKLRLGQGTTAKLVGNGLTLALGGSSRMAIGDDLSFEIELGVGTASVPTNAEGKVGVPGGVVAVKGTANGPGEARIDVDARGDTKVGVRQGNATLVGTAGAELAIKTGESATVAKAGAIRQTAKIPDYYDMQVRLGETPTFTIHDPRGSTALQFVFGGKWSGGGTIEMDKDAKFRMPQISAGRESANLLAPAGAWSYRLRCGAAGGAVASGRIIVVRDSGTRPLPKQPPVNPIDADGRNYRISYQSQIPNVKIKVPGGGSGQFKLFLATGGVSETFESSKPEFTIPGSKLREATYTYWVERDGVKQPKVSTLVIDFDQTAPQVYIESPANGKPFGDELDVRGAVLPGWTAKVDVVEIPINERTRRFAAKVPKPSGANALAIRLSHPQRGVHFYLRRGSK
jgi:hypothetical protein